MLRFIRGKYYKRMILLYETAKNYYEKIGFNCNVYRPCYGCDSVC